MRTNGYIENLMVTTLTEKGTKTTISFFQLAIFLSSLFLSSRNDNCLE
jgi:hypothetical protein